MPDRDAGLTGEVRRRAGAVARRVRTRLREARPNTGAPQVLGVVERVGRKQLAGWISVPAGTPPTPVTLHVGHVQLSSTYPTAGGSMDGMAVSWSDEGRAEDQVPVKRGVAAGPREGRRNSPDEIRTFSFQIQGVWAFMQRRHQLTVRHLDQALPIVGHGTYLSPRSNGDLTPEDLAERVADGHVLTQFGHITLSKKVDTEWQAAMMGLYRRTAEVVGERFGHDVFAMYGTLLGAVREGGYIGHDADFDCAYVSGHTTGPEAAAELVEIALALLEAGLHVDLRHRMLHIHDPDQRRLRIDLFHLFFDDDERLRCPWGVAGTSTLTRGDWTGTKAVDFPGGRVLVPANAEQMVEHVYGDDWRLPKPGFNWTLSRTDVADDATLSDAQRSRVYWAAFYARNSFADGSTFFDLVSARPDLPGTVVDIGCGDGRDSRAFGAAGRRVVGLDQSVVAIDHATHGATEAGLERVAFVVCDVAVPGALEASLEEVIAGAEGPVAFYLRFFLHAVHEQVQDVVLDAIASTARPGDLFAAEFRTDKDEANAKIHGNHYRRFQSAETFRSSLEERHGFEVLYDIEGTGLSPYRNEDPVLYRVIARRGSA
ncbi:class I SAM-dependent methyltransferase [Nocardioides sp. Root140]|uniref:class I SAM-dependent methyltransferase n=1 Tax=Nocardioides sp. Root140 TaxID=1736460 RepID=UPI0006F49C57|nr:class I SAM-dependent methyltransferase [Nocardioides sp. Root140]KQY50215.1 hypothetical protein ASD30_22110 [Nocardioides sp. Root140]